MATTDNHETSAPLQGRRLQLVTFLVTGSMFMEVLDGNIIATALPQMGRSFGVDALELNVAMSAYLLALGVFIPVSGWIADRFGARRVFATAIASFTLTSLLCGLVSDLQLFIALRVLQGASGALMVPVGRLLVLRHTPQEQRMAAMSNLVWPALLAPVIAPALGGFIVQHASWHWIFFINLPLGVVAFALALSLIPAMPPEPRRAFDWLGFGLSGLGIFALLSGMERVAAAPGLFNCALLLTGLALVAASLWHFRHAANAMLSLAPLGIATFRAVMLGGSLERMAISSFPFLLPLMLQVGFQMEAFRAGLLLLVVFVGNFAMKAVTTPLLRHFGYRRVMLGNGSLAALSIAACAFIDADTSPLLLLPPLLACGMTRSMQFTCLSTLAFADVPDRQMSDANGLFNVVTQLSMAAGITLGAMTVRLGEVLAGHWHLDVPAIEYRVAMICTGLLVLLGLLDTLRLPRNAGDHFVARKKS